MTQIAHAGMLMSLEALGLHSGERARTVKADVITRQACCTGRTTTRQSGQGSLEWSANAINFAQKYAGGRRRRERNKSFKFHDMHFPLSS